MTPFARRVRAACTVAAMLAVGGIVSAQPPKPAEHPPAAEIRLAVETLRDVFDRDYSAAAGDAKSKKALALKLFNAAAQRKTPAMILACYDEARLLAAAGGEMKLALAAVDALRSRFSNAPDTLFRDTLKLLTEANLPAADAVSVARLAQREAGNALDREDYSAAVELSGIAAAAAKKSEDLDVANEVRAFKTRIEGLAAAIATIKTRPDDPSANAVLGAYWAFDRGRWDAGLKYLAKGSDRALAEAATQDLAQPKTAKARTTVADTWHKLAKDAPADRKRLLIERAWEWYTSAVTVATGDDDLKPSVRAKEIEAAYPDLFNRTLDGHTAAVAAVVVTQDGNTLVSVGNDNAVRIWDANTGKLLKTLDGHTGWVGSVVVTPDGTKAITAGGDNIIRMWDLKTGKEVGALEGHTVAIRGLALAADGQLLVSGASDKTLRVWDVTSKKELKKFGTGKESVECVAMSPDGKYILAGNDAGVITVYDGKTGDAVSRFDKHAGSMVYTIAVTKDGKTAISGARDKEIRVWDIASGKQLRTLTGHTEQVYQVALSPDEKHLLSASFDRTVRVWDFATGKELKKFEGHSDGVQGACYGPDGHTAFSAGWDKAIRKWRIPAGLDATQSTKKIE